MSKEDKWQPIKTAPKDDYVLLWHPVMVYGEFQGMYCIGFWFEKERRWSNIHRVQEKFDYYPTHWMPLPNPPEEQ